MPELPTKCPVCGDEWICRTKVSPDKWSERDYIEMPCGCRYDLLCGEAVQTGQCIHEKKLTTLRAQLAEATKLLKGAFNPVYVYNIGNCRDVCSDCECTKHCKGYVLEFQIRNFLVAHGAWDNNQLTNLQPIDMFVADIRSALAPVAENATAEGGSNEPA